MVVSASPLWLPTRQPQDDSPIYHLGPNSNRYFAGLAQNEIFRAILNLRKQRCRQIVRLHPLDPHSADLRLDSIPTTLHTSPIYLHETTMPQEAVTFTLHDQQAFHESEISNGILYLTPDGRFLPSESSLDAQPPHTIPEDGIIINDPAMRGQYDGPHLAREIIPRRHKIFHRFLDQLDEGTEDLTRALDKGHSRPNAKMKPPSHYSPADIRLYYLDDAHYPSRSDDQYAICFYPDPSTARQKLQIGQPLEFRAIIQTVSSELHRRIGRRTNNDYLAPSSSLHRCNPRLLQILEPDYKLQIIGLEDYTFVDPNNLPPWHWRIAKDHFFIYAVETNNHDLSRHSYLQLASAHNVDNIHNWIYRDMKLYYYAKKSGRHLYLHEDGHLSPETHIVTNSPDLNKSMDASRNAEYDEWLWDPDSEPSLYIYDRDWHFDSLPMAHVLCTRRSPLQIPTQPPDSVWFAHYTTNAINSTEENPHLYLVDRTREYAADRVSSFQYNPEDYESSRSPRINAAANPNNTPCCGPYGIHNDPEQGT